jgi:hypothetical protein
MPRRLVVGGASVGLSALLAALLITTAPLEQQPRNPAEAVEAMQMQPPAAKPRPRAVVLPTPPRKPPPPPMRALQPSIKAMTRSAQVQPLQPSPVTTPMAKPMPVAAPQVAKKIPATDTNAETARGRVLLRLLEHGQGPAIELAWPNSASQRARLYRRFRDCFGMRVALSPSVGQLYVAEDTPGQNWRPNHDRYSAFARQPSGRLTDAERRDLDAIVHRHGLSGDSPAVRVFPRRVDAHLLGGLDRILGAFYGQARAIRARYELRGGAVQVRDIDVDGRAVPGTIGLNAPCRSAG